MSKKPTAYEFACGALQSYNQGDLSIKIWCEHGVYHVRAHEYNGAGRKDWQVYRTLGDARCHFRFLIRHLTSEVTQ